MKTATPVEASPCANVMPEFVRPADAVRLFGVGKTTLFDWIRTGAIRSYLVRSSGNKGGIRLISTNSLREFITSHPAN